MHTFDLGVMGFAIAFDFQARPGFARGRATALPSAVVSTVCGIWQGAGEPRLKPAAATVCSASHDASLKTGAPHAAAPVLQIANLCMNRNERWFVAGASGSGKTTLLAVFAGRFGLFRNGDGCGKRNLRDGRVDADAWRGRTVGYVPQRLHLIDSLSVLDNLCLPNTSPASASIEIRERRSRVHSRSTNLASVSHELRAGQAQRVAAARAVINGPACCSPTNPPPRLTIFKLRALSRCSPSMPPQPTPRWWLHRTMRAFVPSLSMCSHFPGGPRVNLGSVALSHARRSPLTTLLNVIMLTLGVATIVCCLLRAS